MIELAPSFVIAWVWREFNERKSTNEMLVITERMLKFARDNECEDMFANRPLWDLFEVSHK